MSASKTLKIEILGDPKSAAQAFNIAGDAADGFGSKIATVGKAAGVALAGIGVAAGAASVVSVKSFIEFENELNKVFTLMPGISAEAMKSMAKDVQSFAKEFGVLPNELVPALGEALGAGVPSDNIFQFMEVATKAAIGGAADLDTAVDALTTVVNSFGSDVISVGDAADIMFKTIDLGKASMDELAGSLFQVTPVAAAMGVSFADVGAAIATLTAQGVPTATATTQIRNALSELGKEGTKVSDIFKEVSGVSFQQFLEDGGNLQTALQVLEQHANEAGISMLDMFGSIQAGQAALALTGKGTEAFTEAMEAMQESAGATENAYQTMERGIARQMEKIRASFEVFKLELGSRLAPVFASVAEAAADMLPGLLNIASTILDKLTPAVGLARDGVITLVQALKGEWTDDEEIHPLHRAIGLIGSVIHDTVLPALSDLAAIVKDDVVPAIGGLIDTFREDGLSGLLSELGGILASLGSDLARWATDKIGEVDWAAIGADVRDKVLSGLRRAAGATVDAGVWLKDQITGVDWGGVGSSILDGILVGWDAITDWGSRAYSWITGQFEGLDWSGLGGAILDGILAGWDAITDWGNRAYEWISGQFTSIDWGGLGSAILDGIIAGWETVTDWGSRAYGWISRQFTSIDWAGLGETIQSGIGTAITQGEEIATSIAAQIRDYDWSSLGSAIAGGLQSGISGIGSAGSWLADLFDIDLSGLQSAIEDLMPVLEPFVALLRDNLSEAMDNLRKAGQDLQPLWEELKELWAELSPLLGPLIEQFAELAKTALIGQMAALAVSLGLVLLGATELAKYLTGQFKLAIEGATEVLGLLNDVIDDLKAAWDVAVSTISELIDGGWSGAWERAKGYVSDAVDAILAFLAGLATDGIAKVQELISGIDDKLIELFVNGPKRIWDFVQAGITELGKLVTDGASKAGELPGAVLDAIGDLGTLLLDAGKDVVRGFVSGLTDVDLLGSVKSAASGIANSAKNAVTGALGIQSPSRVMHQLGIETGEGFILGLEAIRPKVEISAKELAAAIVEGAGNDISRLPALVRDAGADFAVEVDKMRVAAEEALILARLRGDEDEIAKFEADLQLLTSILEAWAEETGSTIDEAYRFALSEEQREAARKSYEDLLSDLDSVISGDASKKLREELAELMSMRSVAEQLGDDDLVDALTKKIEAVSGKLHQIGHIMATPIAQGMLAEFEADETAEQWADRIADVVAGPRVGERLQEAIEDLNTKIDLGRIAGAPQEVLDKWVEERDKLVGESTQYWQDVALAASQGLLDEKTLAAYAKAGGEQFKAYLASLVGPEKAAELVSGVQKLTKEAVDTIAKQWAGNKDLARKSISDLVEGLHEGRLDLEDATRIIASVPANEMGELLERLRQQYLEGLTKAVLEGNHEMAASLTELLALLAQVRSAANIPQVSLNTSNSTGSTSSGVYTPPPPARDMGGISIGPNLAALSVDGRPELVQPLAAGHPERDRLIRDIAEAAANARQDDLELPSDYVLENQIVVKLESDEVLARGVNRVNLRNLITEMGPV